MSTRYAILGNSGSGKSTLARQLSRRDNVAVLDLDIVAWDPQARTTLRPVAQASRDIHDFCRANDAGWVVEGCYAQLIRSTFAFAPTLIFLDPGLAQCQVNCRRRPWEPHKYPSKQAQDENLQFLLDWVEDYYQRDGDLSHRAHAELFGDYAGQKMHLTDLSGFDALA